MPFWCRCMCQLRAGVSGADGLGNLDGLVVTLPFKERAMPYATALGPTGRLVAAINALRRELGGGWAGDMFDGMGLVGVARDLGTDFAGASVQLVGAGGVGQAIAFSLAQQSIGRLTVTDLDSAKVESLVHRLAAEYPACEASAGLADLAGIDLLVNATPVGMKPADDLPLAIDSLTERTRVIDIVPRQDPTPLLAPAAAAGCIHAGGAPMVAAQARAVLTFLRGGTRQTLIPSRGDVMKLVHYGALGAEKPGLIDKDGKLRSLEGVVKDIDSEAISPAGLAKLRGLDPASLPEVAGKQRFGVPVAHVPNVICIGLNYTDHAEETGAPIPSQPVIFNKHASALSGAYDPVILPPGSTKLDWEVELAFVIGQPC